MRYSTRIDHTTQTRFDSLVASWGRGVAIASIQAGSIALTAGNATVDATITAVNTSNALLLYLGYTSTSNTNSAKNGQARISLVNATTVRASHQFEDGTGGTSTVGYVVVEFMPGVLKSVQAGTIDVNGGTSNTATITSVNTAKSFVSKLGTEQNGNALTDTQGEVRLALTNATTVTATINTNPAAATITGFMVAEFF